MSKYLAACLILLYSLVPTYCLALEESGTESGKMALELSQLASTHLYNLDEVQLNQTIVVMFKSNPRLKSARVTDYATQEVIASYYRDNSENLVKGDEPDYLSRYQVAKSAVAYQGNVIGLVEIRFQSAEEAYRLDEFYKNVIALVVIVAVFSVLLVFIFKQLSKNIGGNIYLTFGTKKFAHLIFGAISIFVSMSFYASVVMLEHNKANIIERYSDSFHQYLTSLDRTLKKVHEIRDKTFQHIFAKTEFKQYLSEITTAMKEKDDKAVAYYREKMSSLWARYREFGQDGAKIIFSTDKNIIYSQGSPINYLDTPFNFEYSFNGVLDGKPKLLPVEVSTNKDTGLADYRIIFLAPIFDEFSEHVIAVMMIEIDKKEITYNDFDSYHFSESGEIMVFDRSGQLLSAPRFVVSKEQVTSERIFIQDMLKKLKAHGFDNNLAGIHEVVDYRGVPAYAMLNWDQDLNVALVAKMDADELLDDYYRFRRGVFFIVSIMVIFTVPCLLFTLYAGNLSNNRLKDSRREIINRLGHAAEFKDNETALHIFRMSKYTEVIARNFNMPSDWVDLVSDAAPMHDIGKIGVPDAVLQKPGKLTKDEWEVMKKHPKFGADIIGDHTDSKLLGTAKEIALCHHEKWDGTGYPEGLSGEQIPLAARIVAIADVFDALTSSRPYKKAWTFEDAVNLIISESGKHFDPELIKVFKESLPEFKYIMVTYDDRTLEDQTKK